MQTTKQFWTERSADLRKRAAAVPEGLERDLLIYQADQLEAAIVMNDVLAAPKVWKPA
ncbi:hypothetical protein AB8A28_24920 [Tardiphaga sp. 71_E8_N1_1]|uniref:hypothetical protein n=1 Tax=Tardiphaga sp. 71_E8_N1_1 TaxID=3240784 RepID=UPI003F89B5E2